MSQILPLRSQDSNRGARSEPEPQKQNHANGERSERRRSNQKWQVQKCQNENRSLETS